MVGDAWKESEIVAKVDMIHLHESWACCRPGRSTSRPSGQRSRRPRATRHAVYMSATNGNGGSHLDRSSLGALPRGQEPKGRTIQFLFVPSDIPLKTRTHNLTHPSHPSIHSFISHLQPLARCVLFGKPLRTFTTFSAHRGAPHSSRNKHSLRIFRINLRQTCPGAEASSCAPFQRARRPLRRRRLTAPTSTLTQTLRCIVVPPTDGKDPHMLPSHTQQKLTASQL